MSSRRSFLKSAAHTCAAVAATAVAGDALAQSTTPGAAPQRFLLTDLCGSENPTRANFPFVWARMLHEGGHEVRIELAGDAVVLMRDAVANSIIGVGWPPFKEALAKVIALKIPIFV